MCCLNFRCPVAHLKLSAEDLNSCSRFLVSGRGFEPGFSLEIVGNVCGPDIWLQEPRSKIWGQILVCKSRLKLYKYQDPRPRVSDVRSDIWNSHIRQDIVISHGKIEMFGLAQYQNNEFVTRIMNIINIKSSIVAFRFHLWKECKGNNMMKV